MRRKILITILLFSILLGGCGNSGYEDNTLNAEDTWEDDAEDEAIDTYHDSNSYETEPEEEIIDSYPLVELSPFSEERAWVTYKKDNSIYTGIIDTDGNLLYGTEGELYFKSQFKDGLSFYWEENSEETRCGIIDLDGNVLFKSQITPDSGYLILGYGEGHFLVAQHIQNFDTDEWRYGTIDENGDVLNKLKKIKIQKDEYNDRYLTGVSIDGTIKYIGENYIRVSYELFYNLSTAEVISPSYYPETEFGEGYALCRSYDYADYKIMSVDEWINSTNYDIETSDLHSGKECLNGNFKWNNGLTLGTPYSYSEGSDEAGDYGYYDKNWNLVISLEKYRDNDIKGGPFGDGYGAVKMRGTDGELYASAVNEKGELAYDPIKIDDGNIDNSANGYFQVIIDEEEKIIGPDGTIYTPGIDDLSALKEASFANINGGFIISNINPHYIGVDGNNRIDSAKVTSASRNSLKDNETRENDDADELEDNDVNYTEESEDSESSDNVSYIVPSSYDITGKWKSVGDSGFGQAQPGAIVVFNGSHCNFYSPNDTYAFYKDGDKYVLDVTSVLGESLSFTVKIIDDDNIEVVGAKLKRVG